MTAVITTISPPTPSVLELRRALDGAGWPLVVVGDRKGPATYDLPGSTRFLDIEAQRSSGFRLGRTLPEHHYARKNIGYLQAIRDGATVLYETDDDNAPLPSWEPRQREVLGRLAPSRAWFNPYRVFTPVHIWPRGFPLAHITDPDTWAIDPDAEPVRRTCPIQQGLANGSPDVDAIWRLALDADIEFRPGSPIVLPVGTWCPFNSQSTWWWPEAYPLLYLPSHCSFRMTDIWRSFVAQRCLWATGTSVAFHTAEVHQDRNEHDLMRDFRDEIPGYLDNESIVQVLGDLTLQPGPEAVLHNLVACYEALIQAEHLPPEELGLVTAWAADVQVARADGGRDRAGA